METSLCGPTYANQKQLRVVVGTDGADEAPAPIRVGRCLNGRIEGATAGTDGALSSAGVGGVVGAGGAAGTDGAAGSAGEGGLAVVGAGGAASTDGAVKWLGSLRLTCMHAS